MNEFIRSKILCDSEGRFLFIDENFKFFFGLNSENIINNKRIYNFLYYSDVLNFIKHFNLADGCNNRFIFKDFEEKNILLDTVIIKNNENYEVTLQFICNIKIEKRKIFSSLNYFSLIIRSKFLIGSILPVIFSIALSFDKTNFFSISLSTLILFSIILFHVSANTFNDYFDWISGRDQKNFDYFLFSTGGSRVLDFNFVSLRYVLNTAIISMLFVFIIGLYFIYIKGLIILLIGFIAFFCVYFYSAPPIHLASRYGLGELSHIFCLGPLICYGCINLLTNENFKFEDFLISLPFGLIITGCLLMNEYPDSKYDKLSGKMNLPAYLNIRYVKLIFILFIISAFLCVFFCIYFYNFSNYYYFILFTIPYSIKTIKFVLNIDKSRSNIIFACLKSFYFYLYFSIVIITSLLYSILIQNPW